MMLIINNINIHQIDVDDALDDFCGHVNDAITQQEVQKCLTERLNSFGCSQFYVVCDAMVNTTDIIDGHGVAIKIYATDRIYRIVRYHDRTDVTEENI